MQDGPADYAALYDSLYSDFPQEAVRAGALGLNAIRAEQDGHESVDPPVDEIVFRTVVSGELAHSSVDIGDGRRELSGRTGGIYVAPAGAASAWRSTGRHGLLLLAAPQERVRALLSGDRASEDDPLRSLYGREIFDPAAGALVERLWHEARAGDGGSDLRADGLFLTLLGTLAALGEREAPPGAARPIAPLDARRLSNVRDYIDAHLEGTITLEALAGVACLSECHFARRFRAATDVTPYRYVQERRIERATRLLRHPTRPLAEIARACGFATQAHFATRFKALVGVSPRAYRKGLLPARDERTSDPPR